MLPFKQRNLDRYTLVAQNKEFKRMYIEGPTKSYCIRKFKENYSSKGYILSFFDNLIHTETFIKKTYR